MTNGQLFGVALVIAMIMGVIKGLTDDKPSFWRGFGEGWPAAGNIVAGPTSCFTFAVRA